MPQKNHKSNASLGKAMMKKRNAPKRSQKDEAGFKIHTTDILE